ncbi:hypothetical protein PPACK8108_LOCUS10566 [Phakopsora pachyrhizi]|uniref:Uncharacterized protein n=1 Tax=Phakopsora pachyrhizi TaxID=170000 RepID=A0AAV0AYN1_PHAPC|nr:hypothetical protein PPACK8108_LOCUS10566 [Phakopsora pachyrhizi]
MATAKFTQKILPQSSASISPTLPEDNFNMLSDIHLLFQYLSCAFYKVCHILLFKQLFWKEIYQFFVCFSLVFGRNIDFYEL